MSLSLGLVLGGCASGSSHFGSSAGPPISVSLSSSTVVVAQDGTPTHVQIFIHSPSETALVNVGPLPAGVQVTYQATDTNPSGLLTFMVTAKAAAGTSMPIITVDSAGQTAMISFTLIVPTK